MNNHHLPKDKQDAYSHNPLSLLSYLKISISRQDYEMNLSFVADNIYAKRQSYRIPHPTYVEHGFQHQIYPYSLPRIYQVLYQ